MFLRLCDIFFIEALFKFVQICGIYSNLNYIQTAILIHFITSQNIEMNNFWLWILVEVVI